MKKIKEYLQNGNPYLLASVVIVLLSVGIIIALLQETPAEDSEATVTEGIAQVEMSVQQEGEPWDIEASGESKEMDDVGTGMGEKEEPEESSEPTGEVVPEGRPKEEPKEGPNEIPETKPNEGTAGAPETSPKEVIIPETVESSGSEEISKTLEVPEPEEHQHNWVFESYYQEPTCSNGGLVNQICTLCGETQTTIGTPTGKHIYEVESVGDCCSEEVVVCTECNHREVREKDPENHIDEEDGFCYGCGQKTG